MIVAPFLAGVTIDGQEHKAEAGDEPVATAILIHLFVEARRQWEPSLRRRLTRRQHRRRPQRHKQRQGTRRHRRRRRHTFPTARRRPSPRGPAGDGV